MPQASPNTTPPNQYNPPPPEQSRQVYQPEAPAPVQPTPVPQPAASPAQPKVQSYCRGLHDYNATQKSELSFKYVFLIIVQKIYSYINYYQER